jgi:DNA-binding GntR family transcriptional regulator
MLALDRAKDLRGAVFEHRELLSLIAQGKGGAAARLMREHVEHFEAAMRDALLES